ncbi:Sodium channel protein 1 brain [Orchesella cincta]|uniref:Sodium channel protein 1 brain n=1 Tax=Orchesella cincta TaxID=48709 RepID=A0A1D2MRB2_ORCCI|nr:Sodium channel protein 1 brain [Orchesella cincta]
MLAPIRLLKLIQYWPALRMIFKIYQQTLKMLTGWILYGIIVFAFIILIGPFELGTYWMDDFHGMRKVTAAADIPRWSFVDFWHSFRIVFRMQLGEWVETFWDCYQKAGMLCVPYYLLANLCGAVFLSFLLIGIVYSSIKELQGNYDPSKDRGLKLLLRKTCGFICSPIKRIQPKELIMKSQKNGSDTQNSENGADEQAKAKPEGKEGRRKKSIVAESTGQLRKVMQDCTEHILYKIVVCGIIIIASVAMIFENNHAGEDLQTALFVTEILFTILFFVIAIYELLSYGFKESLTNRGWLFDALIVLEMILNLTIYKFSVTGAFRTGVFCIRSFRPLMLIHRIGWLKAAFRAIKLEVKMIWETVLAIFFIWLFFATFGVNWLAGLYHYCINPVDGTELPKWKSQCLASNNSWVNSEFNFDSTSSGFFNMFILSSRMGWVNVIGDATDAVGIDLPRQRETSKMWLIYYIVFLFIGAFGALGILFSYIYNKFQEDKGCDMLLTEDQAAKYTEAKTTKEPKQAWISLEGDYVPPPLSPCLLSFYNMVTNVKFDSLVMVIIILDNVILSLDQYQIYPNLDMVITCMRLAILLLYTIEMIVKLVSWGRHYFRSVWNWIDLFVVVSGIAEALAVEFANNVYSTSVFRMLRLFRIFRFLLAKEYGSTTTKMLFSSLINIRHAFANLFLLQLVVIWAFAILGNYYFENVGKYAGLNNVVNFKSFSSSLWTLILLLGFPGITDISSALGQEEDCIRHEDYSKSDEYPQCGSRAAATGFLGLYASITFMVLLNMYAVLISEIISELERYRSSTSKISNEVDEEMALQAFSNGDGGGELTEDPAENSEEGE